MGYNIEYNLITRINNRARTIVLIKKGISYKRCKKYKNEYNSSVWLEVMLTRSKSFFIMSAYHQWSLLSNLGIIDSSSPKVQTDIYKLMCSQVYIVAKTGKNIVILTDDNVNSLEDNSLSSMYRNSKIKNIRDNMIIKNSLIVYNNKPIFRRQGFNLCMDHIRSNCPAKITNVYTLNGEGISNEKI